MDKSPGNHVITFLLSERKSTEYFPRFKFKIQIQLPPNESFISHYLQVKDVKFFPIGITRLSLYRHYANKDD